MRRTRGLWVVATALIVVLPLRLTAAVRAVSAPVSDRIIEGKIVFPDGEVAVFKAREGTLVTVFDGEVGSFYGFSPLIQDLQSHRVLFTLYRISRSDSGDESISEAGEVSSDPGHPGTTSMLDQRFVIKTTDIVEGSFPASRVLDPRASTVEDQRTVSQASGCCVTCGAKTVCACSVSLSCGSCTDPGCSGGEVIGPFQDG